MKKWTLDQLHVKSFIIKNAINLKGGLDSKADCDLPNTIPACPGSGNPACGD